MTGEVCDASHDVVCGRPTILKNKKIKAFIDYRKGSPKAFRTAGSVAGVETDLRAGND